MNIQNHVDFLEHIQSEIESNKLVLPTIPDVAIKVNEALNNDATPTSKLADIIATDASLSARFIQIANSPLYRSQQEIKSLQIAITRLGRSTVKTLVTSLAMRQIFKPKSKTLEKYFHDIWQQSVNVSAISRALAVRCKHLDQDQAMLGGLIYQIGKLPVLMHVENTPALINDPPSLNKVLDMLHPEIGRLIMNSWDFPQDLKPVVCDYLDFRRDPGDQADYVDVVQVAHIQNSVEFENNEINLSIIPSFSKLGLASEIEVLEAEGIAEDVEQARSLLH